MIQNKKHTCVKNGSLSPKTKKQIKKDNPPEIDILNIPEYLVATNGDIYPNPEYGGSSIITKFNVDAIVKRKNK